MVNNGWTVTAGIDYTSKLARAFDLQGGNRGPSAGASRRHDSR